MTNDKIPRAHAQELAGCFAKHAKVLFGYACFLARGDKALAEDLVQDTFMAAARQWSTLRCRNEAQRLGWLRITIGNLAIGVFRRNEAFRNRLAELEALYRPPTADTHAEAASAITLERCWQTIEALPPRQHAIAGMRWLMGMKNNEIAENLGIAEGTVAAHLSAVRGKLRASLGPYEPFSGDEKGASS